MKALFLTCLLVVACEIPTFSQTTTGNANTKGTCSPATTASGNTYTFYCDGIGEQQGKQIIELLNKVLASKVDITAIMGELDKLTKDTSELSSYGAPTHGELLPGKAPDPTIPPGCTPQTGWYRIFLGDSVVLNPQLPLIAFKSRDRGDFVKISQLGEGISVDSISTDYESKKVIYKIEGNRFVANPNNTLDRRISDDKTTLEITDEYNKQSLMIKFINDHNIRILGTFSTAWGPLIIGEHQIVLSGTDFNHVCFGPANIGLGLP